MPDLLREAETIVRDLGLIALLEHYGEVRLVGSVALDLIVKLDIDLHLLVATSDLLAAVDGIYHHLLDSRCVHEVRITDWRDEGGVKLGIDAYTAPSGDWSIDIWVTNRVESTAFQFVKATRAALRPEHRTAILAIKREFHRRGQLRNGLSVRIYRAVIEDGVRTVADFQRWQAHQPESA
jgi:hypothetical protein